MAFSRTALCAVILLVGCGGRERGANESGAAVAANHGSGVSSSSGASIGASGAGIGTSAPACPITSAQSTLVSDVACYPETALPAGACSGGSAPCSFCSFFTCANVPDQSHQPRTFYSCSCEGGQWDCAVVAQDAGICPPYVEAGSGAAGGGTDASGSTSSSPAMTACDHYFAAQYARGCGGPALPPDETNRIRARFEKVCQNQYALPGSGLTPEVLEACASALEASPCELPNGQPAACAFVGSLPGGTPCNEGFQCESGQCQGTAFFSPEGQIGPTTCGKCLPAVMVGQVCAQGDFSAGCPANASCITKDTSASMPTYTCVPPSYGDIGATCDDLTALCKVGLYCAAQTGQCAPLANANAQCGEGSKPPGDPGGCAPPLSCVGVDAATCSIGSAGAYCLDDLDCAPGLGCIPGPCALSGTVVRIGCAASGTCGPVTWGSPGQPCDPPSTLCLVGSCSDASFGPPAISPEGGLYPGTCPKVIADGQSADDGATYATCDTFAQPFQTDYSFVNGGPAPSGTCALLDSIVCK